MKIFRTENAIYSMENVMSVTIAPTSVLITYENGNSVHIPVKGSSDAKRKLLDVIERILEKE